MKIKLYDFPGHCAKSDPEKLLSRINQKPNLNFRVKIEILSNLAKKILSKYFI